MAPLRDVWRDFRTVAALLIVLRPVSLLAGASAVLIADLLMMRFI